MTRALCNLYIYLPVSLLSEDCEMQKKISCKHSRFCAENSPGTECNSSLLMCIPSERGCNGELDCLQGDSSDEIGCELENMKIITC